MFGILDETFDGDVIWMNLRSVLLVDDEQQILDTYRVILSGEERDHTLDELSAIVGLTDEPDVEEREVFKLIEATQGEEALEKQRQAMAEGSAPTVALVDMRMPPGINGLETSIRLRQQDPSIFIIIITAYSDVESDTMQLALQYDFMFLKKPVIPEELYQIVRNAANAYQSGERGMVKKELDPPLYLDDLRKQQVLLVDDEPMMLKLAEAILVQYLQVTVITASSGQEALQLAHNLHPDLILLDVKMSGMDGYTTCQALKAADTTKDIPVIFLTAQSGDEQVIKGFQMGAVDYVSKPFSKPILVARVSTHLNLYKQSRRLKMLSTTDSLTELPNRAAFETYLEMRLQSAAEEKEKREDGSIPPHSYFALLFIDLDRFKPVNDELGHEVGDQLLQAVAGRLRKNVREMDLISRIGGDEFVLMVGGDVTVEHVALVADNLVDVLCQPFHIEGHAIQIGASVGSAIFPIDAEDGETLLHHADMAMYEAKAKGRNCHVSFSSDFKQHLEQQEQLIRDLRVALEEGQFKLLFQPRFELESRKVIGVDALLRWNHPQRGLLEAKEFIDVLMEGRLGELAERSVLRMVCQQIKEWEERFGESPVITVNLSEDRFNLRDLDQHILNIVEEIGLSEKGMSALEFDVSEALLLKQPEFAMEQLQRLNQLGTKIVLGDACEKSLSIEWLIRFPLSGLKLSRSMVERIGDVQGEQVLKATLCVARELNYPVAAEGIESEVQLAFLQQVGCSAGSGYHLHTTVSGDEIAALISG